MTFGKQNCIDIAAMDVDFVAVHTDTSIMGLLTGHPYCLSCHQEDGRDWSLATHHLTTVNAVEVRRVLEMSIAIAMATAQYSQRS